MDINNEYGLKKTHEELLEMLQILDDLFSNNDVHYCLIYGSELGAVRHAGFIPWDDDIDIGVLQTDLNKAESLLDTLPYLYEHSEKHLEPSSPIGHLRYLYKETAQEEDLVNLKRYSTIDVWPIFRVSDIKLKREFDHFVGLVHNFFVYREIPETRGAIVKIASKFLLKVLSEKFMDRAQIRTYKYITSLNPEKHPLLTCNYSGRRMYAFPEKYYMELIRKQFEMLSLPLSAYYDEQLTSWYGDYMTPPEQSERITEHPH